jgi:hypothetical protein
MRDPEIFKYDVRVRDRMLKAGRISTDEIAKVLDALPDVEAQAEVVPLNQPALDTAPAGVVSSSRQSSPPISSADDDEEGEDEAEDGDTA